MKYRKKPVVIDAVQCAEIIRCMTNDWNGLSDWVKNAYEKGEIRAITSQGFTCGTLEGPLQAIKTDMIIQGVKGEIYPCKLDIFMATYEPVEFSEKQ